jgi:hypothetical protein
MGEIMKNGIAKALYNPCFRQKVVKDKPKFYNKYKCRKKYFKEEK